MLFRSKQRAQVLADVGRIDPRTSGLETGQLPTIRREPIVGKHHVVSVGQRELGQLRADVPGPEDQETCQG